VRATFSPTAALLQLLVVSLLAIFLVFHICGAKRMSRSQAPMLAAGWCWCLSVVNGSIVVLLAQPSSLVVLVLVCEVGCAGWHALQRQPAAPADVACSASGFGQLVLHVENGLLEIFLLVCGSSTPAWSCQDERRQQTSCAAAAGMAEWRARGSCTTARLHSNPSIALTPALADSFSLAYKLRPPYRGSVRSPRCANPTPRDGPTRQICRSLRGAAVTLRLGEFAKNSNSPRHRVP